MRNLIGGDFDVVLADPPWRYDFCKSSSKSIERHYPTMTLSAIAELPVAEVVAPNATLFLWGTAPKLPEALVVVSSWDFIYKTHMVWDKQVIGMVRIPVIPAIDSGASRPAVPLQAGQ